MPSWLLRLALSFLFTLVFVTVNASTIPLDRSSLSTVQARQGPGQQYATDEKGGLWTLEAGSGEASVVTRNDDRLRQMCPSQSSSSNGAIFYLRGSGSENTWAWASVPPTADFRISLALSSSRANPTIHLWVEWNSGDEGKERTFSGATQCNVVLDRDFFRSGLVPDGATLKSVGIRPASGDTLFAFNIINGPFATTPPASNPTTPNTTTPSEPDPTSSSPPSTQDASDNETVTTHPAGSPATANTSHSRSSSTSPGSPVQTSGAQQANGSTTTGLGLTDDTGTSSGTSNDTGDNNNRVNLPNSPPSGSRGVSIAAIVAPIVLTIVLAVLVFLWCRMRRRRLQNAAKIQAVAEPFMSARSSERALPPSTVSAGNGSTTSPSTVDTPSDLVSDEKSALAQQQRLRDELEPSVPNEPRHSYFASESHPPSTRGPPSAWDALSSVGALQPSEPGAVTMSSDARDGVDAFRQGEVSAELYHAMQRVGFSPQSLLQMLNGVSDDAAQGESRRRDVLASPPAYGSS